MPPKRADGRGKKPEGGHIRQIQAKSKRKELVTIDKETGWNDRVAINAEIPKYKAEEDKYCPKARTRKFNEDQKALAKKNSKKGKGASDWLDKALVSKFEDVPVKLTPSLREKATRNVAPKSSAASTRSEASRSDTNMAEVEILQKVIIRENITGELHKLILNQNDMGNVLNEVIELVKAIRFQTVDIMEDIEAWQHMQRVPKPFLYRGQNYVVKIFYDMSFLDKHQMIVDTFGFQFANNPMMYNKADMTGSRVSLADRPFCFNEGSGDRADWSGYGAGKKLDAVVDGVEVLRLEHVEKLIRKEFDRLEAQKSQVVVALPDGNFVDATGTGLDPTAAAQAAMEQSQAKQREREGVPLADALGQGSVTSAASGIGNLKVGEQSMDESLVLPESWKTNQSPERVLRMMPEKRGTFGLEKKDVSTVVNGQAWKKKFSGAKVKKERIMQLSEEVEQLKAIQAHIEDQTSAKVMEYHDLSAQISGLEKKRNLAIREARDVGAQHLAVEIAMLTADKQTCNQIIKDLQRESYFVGLERKRKRGIVKKLDNEVQNWKKQQLIKKKLGGKIQEVGILSALKGLNAMERVVGAQMTGKVASESDSLVMSEWSADKLLGNEETNERQEAEDFFPVDMELPMSPSIQAHNFGFSAQDSRPQQEQEQAHQYEGQQREETDSQDEEEEEEEDEEEGEDDEEALSSSFQEVLSISEAANSYPGEIDADPQSATAVGAGLAGVRALQGNV